MSLSVMWCSTHHWDQDETEVFPVFKHKAAQKKQIVNEPQIYFLLFQLFSVCRTTKAKAFIK